MSSNYIYAGTKVTTLKRTLLTNDQLEVLLAGEDYRSGFQSLHETFLGTYIARRQTSELSEALEEVITDTKVMLSSIAPRPQLLDILWLKYDFYNLQALIKGDRMKLSDEEILAKCFNAGKFTPQKLLTEFRNDKLTKLNPYLNQVIRSLAKDSSAGNIASVTNFYYFLAIKEIASKNKDRFVKRYVELLIDNHNLISGLRHFAHRANDQNPSPVHMPGGTFSPKDLQNIDAILDRLSNLDNRTEDWKEPVAAYRQHGSYAELEKLLDDRLSRFLKQQSQNIFSSAPLFAYFHAKKNNVQLIRTILIGKKSGLSEYEIKKLLRDRFE